MKTRCKFKLNSIQQMANFTGKILVFNAVSDDSLPENIAFTKYTPSGELRVTIDNPAVDPMLKLGGFYYLDIIQAEE